MYKIRRGMPLTDITNVTGERELPRSRKTVRPALVCDCRASASCLPCNQTQESTPRSRYKNNAEVAEIDQTVFERYLQHYGVSEKQESGGCLDEEHGEPDSIGAESALAFPDSL